MDFVWVYAKNYSHYSRFGMFNELEYSIKTVKKFYKDARIWVVGDDPQMDVNYIQCDLIPTAKSGLHRENVDIVKKLRAVLDSDINEEFVMMYDDQFFLQPITKKDLQPTALCHIPVISEYSRPFGLLYGQLWRNTYRTIKEMTEVIYDWETHLPRLMTKEKTRFVLDTYEPGQNNLLVHSIYYTLFAEDPVILEDSEYIRSHTWTIGNKTDYDDIFKHKFLILHDDSIIPEMFKRLDALL